MSNGELATIEAERDKLKSEIETLSAKNVELVFKNEELEEKLSNAQDEIRRLHKLAEQAQQLRNESGEIEAKVVQLTGERDQARAEVEKLTRSLESSRATTARLRTDLEETEARAQEYARQLREGPGLAEQPGFSAHDLEALAKQHLGTTGPILVRKVFSRLNLAPKDTPPERLGEVMDLLVEYSAPLANPDKHDALKQALEQAREAIEKGGSAAPETTAGTAEAVVDQTPPPTPAATPPAEPEPAEPTKEEPASVPTPPAAESLQLPDSEELTRLDTEEEPELGSLQGDEVAEKLATANQLLADEQFEESLNIFIELHSISPESVEVQTGLFYNYVGFSCWMEAYDAGAKLTALMARQGNPDKFVRAMTRVLKERIEQTRDLGQRKEWLLELAELHLDKPEQALKYLRQAVRIPDETDYDGRIAFYLTRLLEDSDEDRLPYLHTYMAHIADSRQVFSHLDQLYASHRRKAHRPVVDTILALGLGSKERAVEAEKNADELQPLEPSKELIDQLSSPSEEAVLKLFLTKLFPAADITPQFPAADTQQLLQKATPVGEDWMPARLAHSWNQSTLALRSLDVLRYDGASTPFVDYSPDPKPTLILNSGLGGLPEAEVSFYLLQELYGAKQQHIHLDNVAGSLDDETRKKLAFACIKHVEAQRGGLTGALRNQSEKLLNSDNVSDAAWKSMLERLYDHTRSMEFRWLWRFFSEPRPFTERLDTAADRFASRLTGLVSASYALARRGLDPQTLAQVENGGFHLLYAEPLKKHRALRQRLQRLWLGPLLT